MQPQNHCFTQYTVTYRSEDTASVGLSSQLYVGSCAAPHFTLCDMLLIRVGKESVLALCVRTYRLLALHYHTDVIQEEKPKKYSDIW